MNDSTVIATVAHTRGGVTEQLLLAEGGHHFGEDTEHRQHQDVHSG